jgi:hypothetical protein
MGQKRQRTKPNRGKRKRRGRGSATRRSKTAARVTFAGLLHDGSRLATIEEVLDPDVATRTWQDLSREETQQLCLRRIKDNDSFVSMRMLGTPDVIDKKRALAEIKKLSAIGLHLLEVDRRYVRLQLERHRRRATEGRS